MLTDAPVLVLNQNYQPFNVCNARRAFVLLGLGKAELMANGLGDIRSVSMVFPVPSVIRLVYMVKRPLLRRRLSRRAIFFRDKYACQYCGTESKTLTLDHIIPRSRGGAHIWDNVVSACIPCNHRKAGYSLAESSMKLRRKPSPPNPDPFSLFRQRTILDEWRPFIPWSS
jgi:5-methylcytosine-specific restriction endonuclease McrA|tara:strand:- start:265 stop:774 length:510 start_codon:yes stop_codon:yes gene_type:complete